LPSGAIHLARQTFDRGSTTLPRKILKLLKWLALLIFVLALMGAVAAFVQGRKMPSGNPQYVALGSSFAAGAGLGPLQDGAPILCARTVGGYPNLLANALHLDMVDMACGGAVMRHVLFGGQYFQGPQIRVIDKRTRLVTITIGGNDTLYIADLSQLAARHDSTLWARIVRSFWAGPKNIQQRDYVHFANELVAALQSIHKQAPQATLIVATYPTILPPAGTCANIGLNKDEATLMRQAADRLAVTTANAARTGGALLVDMHRLGAEHNACSREPWTRGWANGGIAPFHPNERGARATAAAIAQAVNASPAGVTAVH